MNNKSRRYALMSIIGLEKYATVVYNYIYYNLISSYRDSGKMKLAKIEGNGVIENQLVQNGNFSDGTNGWNVINPSMATYSISNNQIMFTVAVQNDGHWSNSCYINTNTNTNAINVYAGHKYLFLCEAYTEQAGSLGIYYGDNYDSPYASLTANQWQLVGSFRTQSSNSGSSLQLTPFFVSGMAVGKKYGFRNIQFIDLTLMFGTGNEPTTLTDNRIQNLLNRGYIAYNAGEYKGTNVGEIATEPYNLANNVFTLGWWSGNVGSQIGTSNYRFDMKLAPISVLPSTSYTLEFDNISGANINGYIIETDENGIVLVRNQYITSGTSITFTSNTHYAYIYFYDRSEQVEIGNTLPNINACFHRTGGRTGYAEHKPSASIPFIIQGNGALNAHDTFEITSSEYVITKNVNSVDLGSLNWSLLNTGNFYCSRNLEWKKPLNDNTIADIICKLYTQDTASHIQSATNYKDKTIGMNIDPQIVVRDSAYTSTADFKTAMAGIYVYLPLATPQVIRIPLKHLGIVDLGSLSWVYDGTNFKGTTIDGVYAGLDEMPNIYCERYMVDVTRELAYTHSKNMVMTIYPANTILIHNTNYTNATQFKNAMSGIYLFYETAEEVDDIVYKIKYENGGTITTNSFSWVENQQIDYANIPASRTGGNLTIAYDSSSNVVEINNTANANFIDVIQNKFSVTANHKYLFASELENLPTDVELAVYDTGTNYKTSSGYLIFTPTSSASGTGDLMLSGANGKTFTNCKVKNPRIIDLTLAFGSGNEPTSINDYRIQDIIAKGYIATNTTGTEVSEPTEVLPNVTMEVQV